REEAPHVVVSAEDGDVIGPERVERARLFGLRPNHRDLDAVLLRAERHVVQELGDLLAAGDERLELSDVLLVEGKALLEIGGTAARAHTRRRVARLERLEPTLHRRDLLRLAAVHAEPVREEEEERDQADE